MKQFLNFLISGLNSRVSESASANSTHAFALLNLSGNSDTAKENHDSRINPECTASQNFKIVKQTNHESYSERENTLEILYKWCN